MTNRCSRRYAAADQFVDRLACELLATGEDARHATLGASVPPYVIGAQGPAARGLDAPIGHPAVGDPNQQLSALSLAISPHHSFPTRSTDLRGPPEGRQKRRLRSAGNGTAMPQTVCDSRVCARMLREVVAKSAPRRPGTCGKAQPDRQARRQHPTTHTRLVRHCADRPLGPPARYIRTESRRAAGASRSAGGQSSSQNAPPRLRRMDTRSGRAPSDRLREPA